VIDGEEGAPEKEGVFRSRRSCGINIKWSLRDLSVREVPVGLCRSTVPGKCSRSQGAEGHDQLLEDVAAAGLEGVSAGGQKEHPRGATFSLKCYPDLVVRAGTCVGQSELLAMNVRTCA
jgi:hypothetical protein